MQTSRGLISKSCVCILFLFLILCCSYRIRWFYSAKELFKYTSVYGMRNDCECKNNRKKSFENKKKITETLRWWSVERKKQRTKFWCDQIQRRGEKLEIIKIQRSSIPWGEEARKNKQNETAVWVWLISLRSYSFSCEAQMLHLWITINWAYWTRPKWETTTDIARERDRWEEIEFFVNIFHSVSHIT